MPLLSTCVLNDVTGSTKPSPPQVGAVLPDFPAPFPPPDDGVMSVTVWGASAKSGNLEETPADVQTHPSMTSLHPSRSTMSLNAAHVSGTTSVAGAGIGNRHSCSNVSSSSYQEGRRGRQVSAIEHKRSHVSMISSHSWVTSKASRWKRVGSESCASKFAEDGEGDSLASPILSDDHDLRRRRTSVMESMGTLEDFFEVIAELGRGSFGVVVEARDKRRNGTFRAVKSLQWTAGEECASKAQAELEIARRLSHPHIVRLVEAIHDGKTVHLVMELCRGGTLHDRIDEAAKRRRLATESIAGDRSSAADLPRWVIGPGGLPTKIVARYFMQMLSGIAYLHHHRYAHRDIKAENYLLETEAEDAPLKLIDFGLSKRCSGRRMMSKVGTPYTTAPEVFEGFYDERCDVWSVGIICFMLCVGYPPFTGETPEETQKLVRRESVRFSEQHWAHVPLGAKNLVHQLLSRDPTQRPKAHKAVNDPWLRAQNGGGLHQLGATGGCCVVS